jgi:hypothetical protein
LPQAHPRMTAIVEAVAAAAAIPAVTDTSGVVMTK